MTATRVLITGITGFVGSHLADLLAAESGIEVWGTRRRRSDLSNLEAKATLIDCELTDPAHVFWAVNRSGPDYIFHLAAQSFVPESHTAPQNTLAVNVLGTLNLLTAVLNARPQARVLVAGSSEEYGLVYPSECPIREDQPFRPMSPYGVSKVAMELLARQFVTSYGLHIVTTRAFNHTGPRRGEQFVTSTFAKQVAEIEAGTREPIVRHGNLDAKRDWTDVRDVVRAYWLAIQNCKPGEPYNICSGHAHRIRDVLALLQEEAAIEFEKEIDESRMRPSDVPLLQGSPAKFRKAIQWRPVISFRETMRALLDYWRARVS